MIYMDNAKLIHANLFNWKPAFESYAAVPYGTSINGSDFGSRILTAVGPDTHGVCGISDLNLTI